MFSSLLHKFISILTIMICLVAYVCVMTIVLPFWFILVTLPNLIDKLFGAK